MFWKKKAVEPKSVSCQCQVPGCGLTCPDEATLKRHTDWAHAAEGKPAVADKPANTPGSQPQDR